MKKIFTVLIFVTLSWSKSFGQNLQKPSSTEIQSLPLWAQKMYIKNPNVWEVVASQYYFFKTLKC